ncbi:hypothetical protein ACHAQH_009880 [Verticillium albo-atrum]
MLKDGYESGFGEEHAVNEVLKNYRLAMEQANLFLRDHVARLQRQIAEDQRLEAEVSTVRPPVKSD